MEKWILKFGCPREIRVDCGKAFESKSMKDFAIKHGITLTFSSPYHHNTNGQIERQFRTMRDMINATLRERRTADWAEILPEIEFTLNATRQKTIGKSPAEIIFGKKISRESWYETDNQKMIREKGKEIPTKRHFEIGDEVLIKVETRNKSQDRFEGPYKIKGKIHDRRYILEDANGKTWERNVEKIKKFLKRGDVR